MHATMGGCINSFLALTQTLVVRVMNLSEKERNNAVYFHILA